MNLYKKWMSIIFCLSLTSGLQAQQSITLQNDSLIQQVIELSIQHNYQFAEKILKKIIDQYPDHPEGYFFMAATIQSKMMDFETDIWDEDFFHFIDLTIKTADNKIKQLSVHDYMLEYYKGSALCYLAFYEGRKGKYLSAIRHSLSGISILKKVQNLNPLLYDVYFGIGSYYYWRSRMTRFVNWLPIISDERESGIRMVKQAIQEGVFTRYAALNGITWILLDAGKPKEAHEYARMGLEKFPRSRFFLWGAAKSSCALKNYDAAIRYFRDILESITEANVNNFYNEYICRINMVENYIITLNHSAAKKQINILKSLQLTLKIKKRLKKQRKRLAKFEKALDF